MRINELNNFRDYFKILPQVEQNEASPEFSFAVSILLIGIVSVIAFYRIKFRK